MGKYDDTGLIRRNQKRTKDTHPVFKGLLNLSHETLKRLLNEYQDTGEAKVWFAIWRDKEDPDKMSCRVDKPLEGRDGGRSGADRGRREDPPFDDRPQRRERSGGDPWDE